MEKVVWASFIRNGKRQVILVDICIMQVWTVHLVMFSLVSGLNGAFPSDASGKEPSYQCRRHKRHGFDPWVRKIPWRRTWQLTPVFLPGESHGQRSLVGYSPWDHKESGTTKTTLKPLSRVWLLVTPWTVAFQAPPSMGFSRQEYWSGLPLPSPFNCTIFL